MRAFLISFKQKIVAENLSKKGVEIIYWTGTERHFNGAENDKKLFPHTIFHHSYDALNGIAAKEVEGLNLECPPQDVLNKLLNFEPQVLEMIARAEYEPMAHHKKVDLFFKYCIYWYGVLWHFKPDVVLYSDVPHTGPNYIIYRLAEIIGIKNIVCRFAKGFPNRLLFFDDFQDYKNIRNEYSKSLKQNITIDDLSPNIRNYYLEQQKKSDASLPYSEHLSTLIKQGYKRYRVLPSRRTLFKNIKNFTFLKNSYNYLRNLTHQRRIAGIGRQYFNGFQFGLLMHKWNRIRRLLKKEYESLQSQPDLNKKYVYFPLHFQPECNTNPMGGIFNDQILLIKTLAKALPRDWVIYIKENPMQWSHYQGHFGRFLGYYKDLKLIPNVHLLSLNTSTYKLIDNAQAVATITGTVGWEALMQLRPTLLFGTPWYMDCHGIFLVNDVNSCKKALEAVNSGFKIDKDKIIVFLHAFDKVSIEGYADKKYQQFSNISFQENMDKITITLLKELNII